MKRNVQCSVTNFIAYFIEEINLKNIATAAWHLESCEELEIIRNKSVSESGQCDTHATYSITESILINEAKII